MLTPKEIASVALANAARRPILSASAERERQVARLLTLTQEGPRYWRLALGASDAFRSSYSHPAQYITLSVGDMDPRYVALASSPHEPDWQFLIDQDSTLGRALALPTPQPVVISAPEGKGFCLSQDHDAPLVLFTTGSGIATMRGVIEWCATHHPSQLAHTHLYYGELDEHAVAYSQEIDRWRSAGVRVTFAFDAPTQTDHPWRFVQQPFSESPPEHSVTRGTFLMSGSAMMLRFASETLLKMGVAPDRLRFNV